MNGKKWTEAEIVYMTHKYGTLPIATIQERLYARSGILRNHKAIELKASRLMLSHTVAKGYVRLAWAHPHGSKASKRIIKAAIAAGVARRQGGSSGNPWIAPEEWVDDFIRKNTEAKNDDATQEILSTWMRTSEVAMMFGLPKNQASCTMIQNRTRLSKIMRDVRRQRIMNIVGQPWYWHPGDVQQAKIKWDKLKLEPKGKPGWRWISEDVCSVQEATGKKAA